MTLQQKALSDWWEGPVHKRGVLRFSSLAIGVLYVITTGTLQMLQLCVVGWATWEQWEHLGLLHLELAVVHPGSATWNAKEMSVTWLSAAGAVILEVPAPIHEMLE